MDIFATRSSIIYKNPGEPPLSPRERSFLRLVMQRDYEKAKAKILNQQVKFMVQHPNTPFYTMFDYTSESTAITVEPIPASFHSEDAAESRECSMLWEHYLRRAVRSDGRLEMQVLKVAEGVIVRSRLLFMRSGSAAIHDARRKIAAQVAAGRIDRAMLLRELENAASLDVLQIY